MTEVCQGVSQEAFLESALRFIDCQAQMLGSRGYDSLAAPGSTLNLVLTSLLTMFIAVFGYRLLLGDRPDTRVTVIAFIKIGIVLALATSWGAYRPLVYDVALHAPAELASAAGEGAGIPGAGGGIVERLAQADAAFVRLSWLGAGPANMATRTAGLGREYLVAQASDPPTIFGPTTLGTTRWIFLVTTIASFASVRLVAGLLLALGPLFIAFLLFNTTRGIFEGWLRALLATVIGAVAVTVILGLELALLEPWLAQLLTLRSMELPIGSAPTELLVVTSAFALTIVAGLGMAARLALAFRVPTTVVRRSNELARVVRSNFAPSIARPGDTTVQERSRAAAVAEAVSHTQRRENLATISADAPNRAIHVTASRETPISSPVPLGQSWRRRTLARASAGAIKRDRR